jgi:hypothetical protein
LLPDLIGDDLIAGETGFDVDGGLLHEFGGEPRMPWSPAPSSMTRVVSEAAGVGDVLPVPSARMRGNSPSCPIV